MIITTFHARKLNYCVTGMRAFCRRHDIDCRKFFKEGVPEEVLLATGDAMALKLVEVAHGE